MKHLFSAAIALILVSCATPIGPEISYSLWDCGIATAETKQAECKGNIGNWTERYTYKGPVRPVNFNEAVPNGWGDIRDTKTNFSFRAKFLLGTPSMAKIDYPDGKKFFGQVTTRFRLSKGELEYQSGSIFGIFPNWIMFQNPFAFLAFFIFFISAVAETNRTPFDIPEAESELVAGWMTEYSGFRWAVFFLSEYANMFVVSGLAVAGFMGGWLSPIPGFLNSPVLGLFWFFGKVSFLIFVMMWFRWTFPRLRVDQLMYVCWKVFIPIAMLNIFGVGIWKLIFG